MSEGLPERRKWAKRKRDSAQHKLWILKNFFKR
jgi:hypothetical protein